MANYKNQTIKLADEENPVAFFGPVPIPMAAGKRRGPNKSKKQNSASPKSPLRKQRYWSRRPKEEQMLKKALSSTAPGGITVFFISNGKLVGHA